MNAHNGAEQPPGTQALAIAAGCLLVALLATFASILAAIGLTSSVPLRIIVVIVLISITTTALMVASDNVEQWLDGRASAWSGRLQWFNTSIIVLSLAVMSGLVLSSLFPDRPGAANVAVDFGVDIVGGALIGAVAIGLTLAVAWALGHLIWWGHQKRGATERAQRWEMPSGPVSRPLHEVLRGVAIGAGGLVLSAICTGIVSTITTNHTGAADTPVPREPSVLLTVVLPILLWFVGTAAVWLVVRNRHGEKFNPHPRLKHGTHASALAICLVLAFAWLKAGTLEGHAHGVLWSRHAGTTPPSLYVTDQQASPRSPYLAQQFEPQMWLANGEQWQPTTVTWYLQQDPKPDVDPPFCSPKGCYHITKTNCDGADPDPSCAPSGASDRALYYRYVTPDNVSRKDRRPSLDGAPWMVIEYWIFYNYDSLQTWAITQWHQADWEQVSVLVRRDAQTVRPVEVAFSEHCYGARLPARYVVWDGSHPVVYVARGSHANYPRGVSVPVRQLRCGLGVTPRYLGVAGLAYSPAVDGSRFEIPLDYLGGVRDRADGAERVPTPTLVSLDTAPQITSFKGNWGLDNNLSPFGFAHLRSSAGPPAPESQGPWDTPFTGMFCNKRWLSPPAAPICG